MVCVTFARARHKQIVKVIDDLARVQIGVLDNWPRHRHIGHGEKGGQPVAVYVHAVLDRLVLDDGQRQAVTDDVHAPQHLGGIVDALEALEMVKLCFQQSYAF